jgi:hypothetical protein
LQEQGHYPRRKVQERKSKGRRGSEGKKENLERRRRILKRKRNLVFFLDTS